MTHACVRIVNIMHTLLVFIKVVSLSAILYFKSFFHITMNFPYYSIISNTLKCPGTPLLLSVLHVYIIYVAVLVFFMLCV